LCFSKYQLRTIFGLKPKVGALPVKFSKRSSAPTVVNYYFEDCELIKTKRLNASTEKQRIGRDILSLRAQMRTTQFLCSEVAGEWLNSDALFLDTETTGLGDDAQIIEIAITDAHKRVLFNSRLKPTVPIDPAALAVHGITEEALEHAPIWTDIANDLKRILEGRVVVVFNLLFDSRLLHQTAAAFGDSLEWWEKVKSYCAMYLAADVYGPTNQYGTISLKKATIAAGIEWTEIAHSAVGDALMTAKLIRAIDDIRANIFINLYKLMLENQDLKTQINTN